MEEVLKQMQEIMGSMQFYIDLEVQKKTADKDLEILKLKSELEIEKERSKSKDEIITELKSMIEFMREKRKEGKGEKTT